MHMKLKLKMKMTQFMIGTLLVVVSFFLLADLLTESSLSRGSAKNEMIPRQRRQQFAIQLVEAKSREDSAEEYHEGIKDEGIDRKLHLFSQPQLRVNVKENEQQQSSSSAASSSANIEFESQKNSKIEFEKEFPVGTFVKRRPTKSETRHRFHDRDDDELSLSVPVIGSESDNDNDNDNGNDNGKKQPRSLRSFQSQLQPPGVGSMQDRCESGAEKIVAGPSHTCALSKGELKCWGDNHAGQLGTGDDSPRGETTDDMGANLLPVKLDDDSDDDSAYVLDMSLGDAFTCALSRNGNVKCWGSNQYGTLAIGIDGVEEEREYSDGSVFILPVTIGTEPDDMGSNLKVALIRDEDPEKPQDHEGDSSNSPKVIALESGTHHTCAIFSNRRMKCFGRNQEGQLGLGHRSNIGEDKRDLGKFLPYIEFVDRHSEDGYKKVASIGLGREHTCVLFEDKEFGCFGSNERGQLGLDDSYGARGGRRADMGRNFLMARLPEDRYVIAFSVGYYHTCTILDTLELYCFGDNRYGQLVRGFRSEAQFSDSNMFPSTLSVDIVQVAAGTFHTCMMTSTYDNILCLGWNVFGQLGRGVNTTTMYTLSDNLEGRYVKLGADASLYSINSGSIHTCVLYAEANARAQCFGMNQHGRLGISNPNAVLHTKLEHVGQNMTFPNLDLPCPELGTLAPVPPTKSPTAFPTASPSPAPSRNPTLNPTPPTKSPTVRPTNFPTLSPTNLPTQPTPVPTQAPSTGSPTMPPTNSTAAPTSPTTESPTFGPTAPTTDAPTASPIPAAFVSPRVESARLSSAGTTLIVKFDVPTNKARMKDFFMPNQRNHTQGVGAVPANLLACDSLIAFETQNNVDTDAEVFVNSETSSVDMSNFKCAWNTKGDILFVQLPSVSNLVAEDVMALVDGNNIRTVSEESAEASGTVRIRSPKSMSFLKPKVEISGPRVISTCHDKAQLIAVVISGSGGRPMSWKWTMETSEDEDEDEDEDQQRTATQKSDNHKPSVRNKTPCPMYAAVTSTDSQILEVDVASLTPGTTYTFSVQARNWLEELGSSSHRFQVHVAETPVPLLQLTVPSFLPLRSDQNLDIMSIININDKCYREKLQNDKGPDPSELEFLYKWDVSSDSDSSTSNKAEHLKESVEMNSRELHLPAGSLPPKGNYTITFTVELLNQTTKEMLMEASTWMIAQVEYAPIVAIVNSATELRMNSSSDLVINASKSCDPNQVKNCIPHHGKTQLLAPSSSSSSSSSSEAEAQAKAEAEAEAENLSDSNNGVRFQWICKRKSSDLLHDVPVLATDFYGYDEDEFGDSSNDNGSDNDNDGDSAMYESCDEEVAAYTSSHSAETKGILTIPGFSLEKGVDYRFHAVVLSDSSTTSGGDDDSGSNNNEDSFQRPHARIVSPYPRIMESLTPFVDIQVMEDHDVPERCHNKSVDVMTSFNAISQGHGSASDVVLRGIIHGNGTKPEVTWSRVDPRSGDLASIPLHQFGEYFQENLVIPTRAFISPYATYKFRLAPTMDCLSSSTSSSSSRDNMAPYAQVSFPTNRAPIGGKLVVSPIAGPHGVDLFTLLATSFQDPEGNLPLRYAFEFVPGDDGSSADESSWVQPQQLSPFQLSPLLRTPLPHIPMDNDPDGPRTRTVKVIARAMDALGAVSDRSVYTHVDVGRVPSDLDVGELIQSQLVQGASIDDVSRTLISVLSGDQGTAAFSLRAESWHFVLHTIKNASSYSSMSLNLRALAVSLLINSADEHTLGLVGNQNVHGGEDPEHGHQADAHEIGFHHRRSLKEEVNSVLSGFDDVFALLQLISDLVNEMTDLSLRRGRAEEFSMGTSFGSSIVRSLEGTVDIITLFRDKLLENEASAVVDHLNATDNEILSLCKESRLCGLSDDIQSTITKLAQLLVVYDVPGSPQRHISGKTIDVLAAKVHLGSIPIQLNFSGISSSGFALLGNSSSHSSNVAVPASAYAAYRDVIGVRFGFNLHNNLIVGANNGSEAPTAAPSTPNPTSSPTIDLSMEFCSQVDQNKESCEAVGCTWHPTVPSNWVKCRPECHFPGNRQNCEARPQCKWENGDCTTIGSSTATEAPTPVNEVNDQPWNVTEVQLLEVKTPLNGEASSNSLDGVSLVRVSLNIPERLRDWPFRHALGCGRWSESDQAWEDQSCRLESVTKLSHAKTSVSEEPDTVQCMCSKPGKFSVIVQESELPMRSAAPTMSPIPAKCSNANTRTPRLCRKASRRGCPFRWVGNRSCQCSKKNIRNGACLPDAPLGNQKDGGCQVMFDDDATYCRWQCRKRCRRADGCVWSEETGCDVQPNQ